MKKLLILMFVFGLASIANAVTLSIDGVNPTDGTENILEGSTIILSVLSDDSSSWMMEVSVLKVVNVLGSPTPTAAAGGMAGYNDWTDASLWIYELSSGGVTTPPSAGEQWTMDLTTSGALGSVFTVDIGPFGQSPVSTIDFTVVPEPMTIALLGLGSLFLLRRRK